MKADSYTKFVSDIFLFENRKFDTSSSELMDPRTFKELSPLLMCQYQCMF